MARIEDRYRTRKRSGSVLLHTDVVRGSSRDIKPRPIAYKKRNVGPLKIQTVKKHTRSVTTPPRKATLSAQKVMQQSVAVSYTKNERTNPRTTKRLRGFSKFLQLQNVAFAMAAVVFLMGAGVSLQGFIVNGRATQAVKGLQEQSDMNTGDEAGDGQDTAVDIPKEEEVSRSAYRSYAPPNPLHARYVRIPSIGVDSRVKRVGKNRKGAVAVPSSIYDAAVYEHAADIADNGGAVFMVGHVHGPSLPGVFNKLEDVAVGAIIEVEQGDGTVHQFQVTSKQTYHIDSVDMKNALRSDDSGKLGLNLMTCGGDINYSELSYSDRVLVKSVKI